MAKRRSNGKEPTRPETLTGVRLKELNGYLEALLVREACDQTHRFTQEFLEARGIAVRPALRWLQHMGGYCDCEVYLNVTRAEW